MVQLSRNTRFAPPLLRKVAGKPHASSGDHEEEEPMAIKSQLTKEEEEALINADPLSSDDETQQTAAPASQPSPPKPMAPASRKPNILDASEPKPRNSRRAPRKIPPPRKGTYISGRAHNAGREDADAVGEKENSAPSSSLGKRTIENVDDDDEPIFGGMEFSRPTNRPTKAMRVAQMKAVTNIHAPGNGAVYSRKSAAISVPPRKPDVWSALDSLPTKNKLKSTSGIIHFDSDSDSESDISMIEDDPVKTDQELAALIADAKKKQEQAEKEGLKIPSPKKKSSESSFLDIMRQYKKDDTPTASQEPGEESSADVHAEGSNTSPSSHPSVGAHEGETLLTLETDLKTCAPEYESDDECDKCPLCKQSVEPSHYRSFWTPDKPRTLRQRTLFCHEHAKHSAIQDYQKAGYPDIDWDALPARIQLYHTRLASIVRNKSPSSFRDQHTKRMTEQRQKGLEIMAANVDVMTQTGYYGSRGSRAMMEAITAQLADVMREAAVQDVGTYVFRVLVPELSIWLVMDDFQVSENMAKGIITESGELGARVNEEVGDVVEEVVGSEDEEDG